MFDIITIGSITRDNFLEADYTLAKWPKAPSGQALVLPFGEKLEIKKVHSTMGGNSANASVTFARQGFRTACFGKVGDDLSGKEIQKKLQNEKVRPLLAFSKEKSTAYSVLLLEGRLNAKASPDRLRRFRGERTILGYHGAADTLTAKDIPWNQLKSSWWYLSLAGESDKFLKPLLAFAKKHGIKVAFNPSGHHIRHKRKEILASLKDVAFLVLNKGEAADLLGMSFRKEKELFSALDRIVPGIVAVTDGKNGVTVSDGKYIYKAGIFPEKKVIDRTGAGDAFGSGFVAGLMRKITNCQLPITNYPPEAIKYAIRLASANATAGIEKIGATEGLLTIRQFNDPRWKNLPIKISKLARSKNKII